MKPDRSKARRALLRSLVGAGRVAHQEDAVRRLARKGHRVTQATVSRDLMAIGAKKRSSETSPDRYVLANLPADNREHNELAHRMREFVAEITHSGNLALLRTPPGAAAPVASALDHAPPSGVLGTIAGDDTVLVVARSPNGGAAVARRLRKILEGTDG